MSKISEQELDFFFSDSCYRCPQVKKRLSEIPNLLINYWNTDQDKGFKKAEELNISALPFLVVKVGNEIKYRLSNPDVIIKFLQDLEKDKNCKSLC